MRFILVISFLFIASCTKNNQEFAQIKPETLLSSNVEDITFAINGRESLDSMFQWVLDDRPTNAVLYCASGDALCNGAEKILTDFSIPYSLNVVELQESTISLVYNRLLTKNCSNGIGCAMSANFISAITDQTDFTDPSLSDYQDAQKAVENFNNYYYSR